MQAGLARGLDDRFERHAVQQFAQPERDLLALLERDRVELGFRALRFLARIDVRVEVEQHVVGIVQHRALERFERRRIVGALRHRIRSGFRARVPDVVFERPRLREPQQRRQVVAQQVVVLLVLVRENTVIVSTNAGRSCSQCFWKNRWPPMPSGIRIIVSGRSREMRQHVRRHLREIGQQVALRVRGQVARGIRGPVDAIEVREPDPMRPDGEREGRLLRPRAARRRRRRAEAPAGIASALSRRTDFGSTSSRRRRNTGARSRRPRSSCGSSARRQSRARPRSSAPFSSGVSANGHVLRCSVRSRDLTCASVRSSKPDPTCDA